MTEINEQFQDGIFAMIGLIPKIFEKEKIPADNFIDIKLILKYLGQKAANNTILAKRIPILCSRWIKLLDCIIIIFIHHSKSINSLQYYGGYGNNC